MIRFPPKVPPAVPFLVTLAIFLVGDGRLALSAPVGIHVAETTPPPPTGAEREQGFILFSRNTLRVLFPTSLPRAEERATELALTAARGESEPVVLAVYALRELRDLRVEVDELRGPGGTVESSRVEVRSIRYLAREGQPRWDEFHRVRMEVPYFLEFRERIRLEPGSTQPYWITVHVPEDASPGEYAGTAIVRTMDAAVEVPLRLRVHPFALDEAVGIGFGFYVNMPGEPGEIEDRYLDLRAHGMTTAGLCGPAELALRARGKRVVIEWTGRSALERNMDAMVRAGLPGPVVWLMRDRIPRFCERVAPPGSSRFAEVFGDVIRQVNDRAVSAGWPAIIYQPVDEPFAHPERLELGLRLLRILDGMPEIVTGTNGMNGAWERFTEEWYRASDVLTFHDGPVLERGRFDLAAWDRFRERALADGKRIWFYNIDLTGWHPEPVRFWYGFGLARSGGEGVLQWLYMRPSRRAGAEAYGKPGAWQFRLPVTLRESGGPTVGYEAAREGVDDYRYLVTLRRLVVEARASKDADARRIADGIWSEVQARLDAATFEGSRGLAVQGDWTGACEVRSDGVRVVRGDLKLDNGWNFEDYDALRRRIAEGIVRLRDVLDAPR